MMSNNARQRTNQLIKVEKENENLELRKRIKSATKDKHGRRETVCDRLSKPRKSPSSENLGINRSRQKPSQRSKPSQRFQIMKQMAASQQQQQLFYQQQMQLQQLQQQQPHPQDHNNRPLTPYAGTNRLGSRKHRLQKAIILPEVDNQGFVYVCKPIKSVNEILTARSLNNSKSSSDDYKTTSRRRAGTPLARSPSSGRGTAVTDDKLMHELSEDSADEYKLAPLMSSRSHYELKSSTQIIQNFHEVLRDRGETSMEPEALELVKNVIKFDERYPELDNNNPKLFKDILKSQLQDILKHEFAVKQALDKLESNDSLQRCHDLQTMQPIDEIVAYGQRSEQPKKLEVDVVFKNVPSLEREIIMLRALGEKLEATLKRTSSQRSANLKWPESKALNTGSSLMVASQNGKMFMLVEIKSHSYILALESYAHSCTIVQGLVRVTGVAQEFRIAQKTIIELKEEANRPFYIPLDPETAELQMTSFKKLMKESPDILMRHIKAKNSSVPFNVLDHDPVFFNNILFSNKNHNEASKVSRDDAETQQETEIMPQPMLCEGGDSRQFHRKSPPKLLTKGQDSKETEVVDNKLVKSTKLMQSSVRGNQRRRIGRCLTPLSPHKTTLSPKNNLFKTILIGSVQISCFMLLIMAFTFPDVKC